MDKLTKNCLRNLIAREYYKASEEFYTNLKKDEKLETEFNLCSEKASELFEKLLEVLPEEYKYLLDEYDSASNVVLSIESHVAFKEGLVLGVTELNFLTEFGTSIAFI